MYKNGFGIQNLQWLMYYKNQNQTTNQPTNQPNKTNGKCECYDIFYEVRELYEART